MDRDIWGNYLSSKVNIKIFTLLYKRGSGLRLIKLSLEQNNTNILKISQENPRIRIGRFFLNLYNEEGI